MIDFVWLIDSAGFRLALYGLAARRSSLGVFILSRVLSVSWCLVLMGYTLYLSHSFAKLSKNSRMAKSLVKYCRQAAKIRRRNENVTLV